MWRCAECGDVWCNGKAMARSQSQSQRQHTRLRHNQRTYLPVKYGEPQCGFHRAGHDAERAACETEPNRYPSDERTGKQQQR